MTDDKQRKIPFAEIVAAFETVEKQNLLEKKKVRLVGKFKDLSFNQKAVTELIERYGGKPVITKKDGFDLIVKGNIMYASDYTFCKGSGVPVFDLIEFAKYLCGLIESRGIALNETLSEISVYESETDTNAKKADSSNNKPNKDQATTSNSSLTRFLVKNPKESEKKDSVAKDDIIEVPKKEKNAESKKSPEKAKPSKQADLPKVEPLKNENKTKSTKRVISIVSDDECEEVKPIEEKIVPKNPPKIAKHSSTDVISDNSIETVTDIAASGKGKDIDVIDTEESVPESTSTSEKKSTSTKVKKTAQKPKEKPPKTEKISEALLKSVKSPKGKSKSSLAKASTAKNSSFGQKPSEFNIQDADLNDITCGSEVLSGLTFVATGNLSSMDRDQIKGFLQQYGARVTGSISSKTDFIVAGEGYGESKFSKAKDFKIPILSEQNLKDMITEKSKNASPNESGPASKKAKFDSSVMENLKVNVEELSPQDAIPWVDTYAPKSIESCVGQSGPKSSANKLVAFLKHWTPGTGADGKLSVLISGPPGIGKTTMARLAAEKCNMKYYELNASDARSAKTLKSKYGESMKSDMIEFGNKKQHCIIMDEVDGISGTSDRGGLAEIVKLVKHSQVPIIFICNDRSNLKIRTLANYCLDLRVYKPKHEQIKALLMKICFQKKIELSGMKVSELVNATNCDIRMAINYLQMQAPLIKAGYKNVSSRKDQFITIFDVCKKLLSRAESAKLSYYELTNLFFHDYSACALFMFENYLSVAQPHTQENSTPQDIKNFMAVKCMSESDCVSKFVTRNQDYRLLTANATLSTVIPSKLVSGNLQSTFDGGYNGGVKFPSWFGKNSTTGKNNRLISQIANHSKFGGFCTSSSLSHEILPFVAKMASDSELSEKEKDFAGVIKSLYLSREDLDFTMILCGQSKLDVKYKNLLFKTVVKDKNYRIPYSQDDPAQLTKKKKGASATEKVERETSDHSEVEEIDLIEIE